MICLITYFAQLAILLANPLSLPSAYAASPQSVTVYAYDAFTSEGALGPLMAKAFEKKFGIKTHYVGFATTGEALNQIALEGSHTHADLVVGIDNTLVKRAKDLQIFANWESKDLLDVPPELRFDPDRQFLPFDYGFVSLVYDQARGTTIPAGMTLSDFAKHPASKRRLILEDPRTSSLGLAFLTWTHCLFGDEKSDSFWDELAKTVVTTAPGWSGAYALFLRKEADFVVSYTTSPAYHREKENKKSFRAVVFPEGNFRQIESVGIIKYASQLAAARQWGKFLLSTEIQAQIPTSQWMYPAVGGTKLPASFLDLPKVTKVIQLEPSQVQARTWLKKWVIKMSHLK